MKRIISPAQNLHFVDSSQPRNYLVSTLFKPSYVHSSASTDSHGVASTSCASSHECEYMPRPTPPPPPPQPPRPNKTPRPSKGRGPTIAIYSYLYLSIARWVNINPQTQLGTFFSGFPKVFTASGPCSSSRGGRFMVWVNHGLIIRQNPISIHMILNGSEWELMVSNLLLISIQEPLFLISNIPMVFLMFV